MVAVEASDAVLDTVLAVSEALELDDNGWTALHHAAARGSVRCVATLLRFDQSECWSHAQS